MDWYRPFDTDILFIKDLFDLTSPVDIADTLTDYDLKAFTSLSVHNMVEKYVTGQYMTRWHLLSRSVWECCSAFPDFIEYIRKCLEVSVVWSLPHPLFSES